MSNYVVLGEAMGGGMRPIDVFAYKKERDLYPEKSKLPKQLLASVNEALTAQNVPWLPAAAEVYQISANIADYLLVPVVIMPTDLPNRNMVAFPYEELTRFNHTHGKLAYQTWAGKPTYIDHANQIPREARGLVIDVALRPMVNYKGNLYKVITLLAFDRNKDTYLARMISNQERTTYSMGAMTETFRCSICGADVSEDCGHSKYGVPQEMQFYDGKLAYWNAINPVGFEVSSVSYPAYVSAENPDTFSLTE